MRYSPDNLSSGLLKEAKKKVLRAILRSSGIFARRFNEPRRILLPAYTGLGNFILKTPMIRELRERFPEAQIDLLCGNAYGTEFVLRNTNWINETISFPFDSPFFDQLRFYWRLRRRKYDVVLLFFDTAHVRHLFYGSIIAGIPKRIGHFYPSRPMRAIEQSTLTDFVPARSGQHEVDLNFDLLDALGRPGNRRYDQTISVSGSLSDLLRNEMSRFGARAGDYLVLQLTAANGQITPKIWPADHFRELIKCFLEKEIKIVVLGDLPEREQNERILAPFGSKVLNLVGRTNVSEAALIIQQSKGLICHDSGLMHIGNALNVPLIALIGPTDYDKNRPLGPKSNVMRLDNLSCMPCLGLESDLSEERALALCPIEIRCMKDLTPEAVKVKAAEIFKIEI